MMGGLLSRMAIRVLALVGIRIGAIDPLDVNVAHCEDKPQCVNPDQDSDAPCRAAADDGENAEDLHLHPHPDPLTGPHPDPLTGALDLVVQSKSCHVTQGEEEREGVVDNSTACQKTGNAPMTPVPSGAGDQQECDTSVWTDSCFPRPENCKNQNQNSSDSFNSTIANWSDNSLASTRSASMKACPLSIDVTSASCTAKSSSALLDSISETPVNDNQATEICKESSADVEETLRETLRETSDFIARKLTWRGRAESVMITGSWLGWSEQIELRRSDRSSDLWETEVVFDRRAGDRVELKFIVDSMWMTSSEMEMTSNNMGSANNVLDLNNDK